MRLSHWLLTGFAGAIWLGVGLFLLNLGVGFVLQAAESGRSPLLLWFGQPETGALTLFGVAIIAGLFKGRTVIRRAAMRISDRIQTLPNPSSLLLVYGSRTYILIFSMIALGVLLRLLGVPEEIRGTILVAVGTALLHGGVAIVRTALNLRVAT